MYTRVYWLAYGKIVYERQSAFLGVDAYVIGFV